MMTNFTWLGFLQFLFISVYGEGIGVPVVGRSSSRSKSTVSYSEPLHQRSFMNYLGKIRIGTPKEGEQAQEFTVLFDTGSSDLIVLDVNAEKRCTIEWRKNKCESARPNRFDTSKSSTYARTEGTFSTLFLDNSGYTGHVAHDFIELGEGESKLRVVATIGLSDDVANESFLTDGVFGVGLRSETSVKPSTDTLTPIECIFAQTNIRPQIAYYIERNERLNINGHYYGEIYFGGYNSQYVASEFMGPVSTIYHNNIASCWLMDLISIKVGENSIDIAGQDLDGDKIPGTVVRPDTGSTFTSINENVYDQIMSYVFPGMDHSEFTTRGSRYLCDELPDYLPEVEFIFNNDVTLKFGPEIYIRTQGSNLVCSVLWESDSDQRIIFGNDILQKYYTVFDYEKKEMKFALAKQNKLSEAKHQPGKYGKLRLSRLSEEDVYTIRKNYKEGKSVFVPRLDEDISKYFL